MASITEQTQQVFGFTPKGLDQEVKKYKPEPSKGLGYGELIVDNILGLDNEYESFGEKLGKAINEDEIKFLKDASVGIYEGAKEFIKAPVETTKQIVGQIKNSVTRLGSEDLNTRLQRMFKVSYEQATDEQINQAREAVLGDALTALELIPAAAVTTSAAKVGIGAIPSGFKADAMGTYRSLASGDPKEIKEQMSYLMTPASQQPKPKGVGANVPGMFPKRSDDGITEYLEEEALDPDFSVIDMDQKYGQYLPSGEAFKNAMRDDKLNLRSLSVDPYIPLLVDTLDGVDSDEYTITEAFDTITKDLKDVAKQRSSYYAPLLNDKDIKLEDVPSITDQQINKINEHGYYNFNRRTNDLGFGPKFKEISEVTLPDVVTTDYFEQVQADLLFSIEKKIKKEIPELPFNQLARLVGLSNSDKLLSDITKDQLATMNTYSEASTKRDFLDKQLTEFIIESGLLDGHYISDPRKYRRVTKNPINDSENFFDLDANAAFFADLTPRTTRVDANTGRTIKETDPGKIIDGQRKYKFEAVFGAVTTENPLPLFNVTNNESFLINGIKESLKDYLRKLDLNQKTPQGDTLGEVSKVYTEDLIATEARRELISGPNTSKVKDLENIGKIVLLELGQAANKAVPGARVLEALENDPRIKNANIPPYFKSSQFKGRMVTPLEYEELADEYYKKSPAVTYPEEVSNDYDRFQRQDFNENPDSGRFVGGNVVETHQKEIIAEAGPENRVPAFTVREEQHYDDRGLAHTRYTEIEPIDVTDESAIRETYPELELRDLDTDLAKGLEDFESIINYENYFLVDELQSDLISKGYNVYKRIPFTKEVVRNALDSGSNKSIINQAMLGFDIDVYKDEIFEKLPELVDLYHNTVDKDDLSKIPELQDNILNSILKKEKKSFDNLPFEKQKYKIIYSNKSLGDVKSLINRNIKDLNTPEDDYFKKQKKEYFAQFEVNLRHFLNQAERASHYDKNYTDNNVGLPGVVRQATINRKSRENPDSYKKPPITTTEEAVQQIIQRLIFDANKRGVNKIVIPNFDRIASASRYSGEKLFHALQNKSYNSKTGEIKDGQALYKTYVSSLEKVLPKFEKAYGITIHRDVTLPYLKDGISDFSKRSDVPLRRDKEFLKSGLIRFSDKGIILDITNMKQDFDLSRPTFAEGGDTVRPEPRPDIVDVSPRAEAGDQDLIKKDSPFPNVKPKQRPDLDEYRGRTYDLYSVEIDGRETNIIEFKDGSRMSMPQVQQMFEEYKSASEPIPGKQTTKEILNFLQNNNPTKEEFIRHFTTKRLNKGGSIMNEQMQMAFMNEGGLRDDGMNRDPVSGNDVPSGSLAEEVRDDIPAQLSEGEYVVPADVVRYYGVKFFEDLRERAKIGLQEMEMNGRIGGEPVPAGGPTDGPLTSEEMAVLQELGMAEGGVVDVYKQQTELYTAPNPAIGNTVQMYQGGEVRGYDPGGDVTQPQQAEKDFYSSGAEAQQAGFVGFPLGTTVFGPSPSSTAVTNQRAFTPVELINTKPPHDIVMATTQELYDDYTNKGYVLNDGSFTPPVMRDSGGDGGGTTTTTTTETEPAFADWGTDVDWNSENGIRDFVTSVKKGDIDPITGKLAQGAGYMLAGIPGAVAGAALTNKGFLQSVSDLRASQLLAEAKGFTELSESIGKDIDSMLEGKSGITKFLANVFASGKAKSNGVIETDRIDTTTTTTPKKLPPQTFLEFGKSTTREAKNVKASKNIRDKRRGSGMGRSTVTSTGTGADREYTSGATRVASETGADTSAAGVEAARESLEGRARNIGGRNKGGLMTKGKKKKKK